MKQLPTRTRAVFKRSTSASVPSLKVVSSRTRHAVQEVMSRCRERNQPGSEPLARHPEPFSWLGNLLTNLIKDAFPKKRTRGC